MKYLIIDGELSGTGIRDKYAEGYAYISLNTLNISPNLVMQIQRWQQSYENLHFNGYDDKQLIAKLDGEGIDIAKRISEELKDVKIEYYSGALLKTLY